MASGPHFSIEAPEGKLLAIDPNFPGGRHTICVLLYTEPAKVSMYIREYTRNTEQTRKILKLAQEFYSGVADMIADDIRFRNTKEAEKDKIFLQ